MAEITLRTFIFSIPELIDSWLIYDLLEREEVTESAWLRSLSRAGREPRLSWSLPAGARDSCWFGGARGLFVKVTSQTVVWMLSWTSNRPQMSLFEPSRGENRCVACECELTQSGGCEMSLLFFLRQGNDGILCVNCAEISKRWKLKTRVSQCDSGNRKAKSCPCLLRCRRTLNRLAQDFTIPDANQRTWFY